MLGQNLIKISNIKNAIKPKMANTHENVRSPSTEFLKTQIQLSSYWEHTA